MNQHAENSVALPTKRRKLRKNESSKESLINYKRELPLDILTHVFSFLSLKDIKTVRRVSQYWYDVANQKEFRKHERIMFCGIYTTESIISECLKFQNNFINLEFYRVNFGENHEEFFQMAGTKIISLHFVDCIINPLIWREVIMNCVNMEQLSIAYYHRSPQHKIKCCNHDLLINLCDEKIIREKLKTLSIDLCNSQWMSNLILKHFFIIFPNISRLSMSCKSLDSINSLSTIPPNNIIHQDLISSKTFNSVCILQKIHEHSNSMEKLALDLETSEERNPGFAMEYLTHYVILTSLRDLDLNVDLKKTNLESFISFLTGQRLLKKLSIKIHNSSGRDLEMILDSVIKKCYHLRTLHITCRKDVTLTHGLVVGLTSSALRSLSIDFNKMKIIGDNDDQVNCDQSSIRVNSTMKHLQLTTMPIKYTKLLIKVFQNLDYLEIESVTDEILQYIWMYQKNLKHLKLCDVSQCTIKGFLPVSFSQLRRLEALTMLTQESEWQESEKVFSDFLLPGLRCICVDIECSVPMSVKLLEMLRLSHSLEYVSLNLSDVPQSEWMLLGSTSRKLRYYEFQDTSSEKFKKKEYEKLFLRTKTLRVLTHKFKSGIESFYLNLMTNIVERKQVKTACRISTEKIGGVLIDWLWF